MVKDKGVKGVKDLISPLANGKRDIMAKIRISCEEVITSIVQLRNFDAKSPTKGKTFYITIPHNLAVSLGVTKGEKWTLGIIKRENSA